MVFMDFFTFLPFSVTFLGVRRGVSKRKEDGCRPPTLQAGHPCFRGGLA
jgi:hypothetical protein